MTKPISASDFDKASKLLGAFILDRADATARKVGFGWTASADPPTTYPALQEGVQESAISGSPLAVSLHHNEGVVAPSKFHNMALRFWHDIHHVLLGLDFTTINELELGLWHLDEMRKAGFKPDDLAYQMMELDILGQNYLVATAGRFPYKQRKFVKHCLEVGLHQGVLDEYKLAYDEEVVKASA